MKLAIMQPYLFPYAGYYNLVSQVDKFIFYDDVNFIKNGWINRNRLILSGETRYFTIPLSGASPNLKINQIKAQPRSMWERKMLESIRQSYSKAPNFVACFDLFKDILDCNEDDIATLARRSVIKPSERFGFKVNFVESSKNYSNEALSGAVRVIDICCKEQADTYINLPGGRGLYSSEQFTQYGVDLRFTQPLLADYRQFGEDFKSGLSIIDMMMFNDFETCAELIIQEQSA